MIKEFFSHPVRWIMLLLVSALIVYFAILFQDKLVHFRSLGLLGIFLINFFANATIFIPAPAIATVVGGGALYPPTLVSIASTTGGVLGDSIGYFIGFSGHRLFINRQKRLVEMIMLFRQFGGLMIFIFAFFPNPFFDAVGLIAGGLGYPFWRYMLWLFIGRFARNLLLAFLGTKL